MDLNIKVHLSFRAWLQGHLPQKTKTFPLQTKGPLLLATTVSPFLIAILTGFDSAMCTSQARL